MRANERYLNLPLTKALVIWGQTRRRRASNFGKLMHEAKSDSSARNYQSLFNFSFISPSKNTLKYTKFVKREHIIERKNISQHRLCSRLVGAWNYLLSELVGQEFSNYHLISLNLLRFTSFFLTLPVNLKGFTIWRVYQSVASQTKEFNTYTTSNIYSKVDTWRISQFGYHLRDSQLAYKSFSFEVDSL